MNEILTSRQNPLVVKTALLKDKKYRQREKVFLAEGTTLLSEALLSGVSPQRVFATPQAIGRLPQLPQKTQLVPVAEPVLEKLTTEDASDGVVSVFDFLPPRPARAKGILILESLQDPGNVGTVVRTAAALGVGQVWLYNCADLYNPKTVRATMGALFRQSLRVIGDLAEALEELKSQGVSVFAAACDPQSKPLDDTALPEHCAVMIGNEGHGLSARALEMCDRSLTIPMTDMESLNAALAAGIFMWEMTRKARREKA